MMDGKGLPGEGRGKIQLTPRHEMMDLLGRSVPAEKVLNKRWTRHFLNSFSRA